MKSKKKIKIQSKVKSRINPPNLTPNLALAPIPTLTLHLNPNLTELSQ
jgi:hypothetical protein